MNAALLFIFINESCIDAFNKESGGGGCVIQSLKCSKSTFAEFTLNKLYEGIGVGRGGGGGGQGGGGQPPVI